MAGRNQLDARNGSVSHRDQRRPSTTMITASREPAGRRRPPSGIRMLRHRVSSRRGPSASIPALHAVAFKHANPDPVLRPPADNRRDRVSLMNGRSAPNPSPSPIPDGGFLRIGHRPVPVTERDPTSDPACERIADYALEAHQVPRSLVTRISAILACCSRRHRRILRAAKIAGLERACRYRVDLLRPSTTGQTSARRVPRCQTGHRPDRLYATTAWDSVDAVQQVWRSGLPDKPSDDWLPSAHECAECSSWMAVTNRTVLALGTPNGGSERVLPDLLHDSA